MKRLIILIALLIVPQVASAGFVGYLKADTQIIVTIGPFVDVGDGFTPQTDIGNPDTNLTGVDEAELLKHGSVTTVDITTRTWAAIVSVPGYYGLTLTTTDTNTEGLLTIVIQDDSDCLPVRCTFVVVNDNTFEAFYENAAEILTVNTTQVSDDSTSADNLELMYDGTGYTNETGPASRAQVDNIGAASGGSVNINISEDNTGGAIDPSSATFVGSVQGATTFANLEAADGVVHDIDDVGDDIDIVYGCSVGGGRTASVVSILANVDGNNDEIKVKAYDHVGADWEIIGTVEGSGGTTFKALDLDLLLKHTGTGGELGKVYIRFETDSTTPSNLSADKVLVKAVSIGQSVGYANGRIWVDTNNGVAGTEAFVNGVADNAVNLIASAKTLSASIGVSDFHIINGSTITLAEGTTNESYFGDNWTLALGGQDVDEAYFQGAHVSGVGTSATEVHYEGCDVGTMSVQIGHFDFCSFDGTVTHTLAGDYEYHNCYSNIAGAGAPTFTKTAGQAMTAEWRNWMDSITVSGLQSGDTITINGRLGTVTLNGADATVEIRGSYKSIVNNLTGSPTVNIDGAWQGSDIADILTDTGTTIPGTITTAQNDLDTITGGSGVLIDTDAVDADALKTDAVTKIWAIQVSDLAAGAPAVDATVLVVLNWIYEAWRNKTVTNGTSSEIIIYKNDTSTPLVESDISDDGTDFTRGEMGAPD